MESLLQTFLCEQGYALFEPAPGGKFTLMSEPPQWLPKIWGPKASKGKPLNIGSASPYLENFLPAAQEFWNSRTEEVCVSGTWVERTPGREEIPLEAVALRVNGQPLLSIHSPKDEFQQTTRYLQTARESKLAHERLLREIQKKEILLHCIVHDLSQPLAAMRGCFECLTLESTTPKAKQFVEIGKQQTVRQETLIREIVQAFAEDLKTTMSSAGPQTESPNLLTCVRDTVTAFSPMFESKSAAIRMSPEVNAAEDWRVSGEESRLRRILSNLVENSLRYTPRDSTVTIGLDGDRRFIRAFVDDEGPGLPAESSPSRMFALFSKGKDCGGKAGLGLYFCKMTVERWGGSIGCESLPERGARFWFRLPRAEAKTANPVADLSLQRSMETSSERQGQQTVLAQAPMSREPTSTFRILLAEDQEDLRQLTAHLLSKQGHVVTAVPDGRKALQALTKQRFDVVLLDEEMPGMTGVEVTRRIREREKTSGGHQVIVALTGNTTEQDQQRLFGAGVDGWLGKPFHLTELLHKLGELNMLPATKSKAQLAAPQGPDEEPDLLARVGGNAKLLRTMIKTFLPDSRRKLSEMKRALSRKNGIALAAAAHALKGSASIFGSEKATRCAQQLQEMGRKDDLAQAPPALKELEEEIALLHEKLRGYGTAGSHPAGKAARRHRGQRSKRAKRES
jgi:signal transduction histidine kinase/HPt (histidine-containing phosphotransfer) domain-containing protein/ActR/RegA family two-component response regulator